MDPNNRNLEDQSLGGIKIEEEKAGNGNNGVREKPLSLYRAYQAGRAGRSRCRFLDWLILMSLR